MTDLNRNVYCLLGLPFDAVDMAGAIKQVQDAAVNRTPLYFSTPNLNFLIGSRQDTGFRDSVINSHLSVADGMPLVWIARLLGIPINERVAGSALFEKLGAHRDISLSVYFFGGQEGVAEAAFHRLNFDPKGFTCVGFHCPGFGSIEDMSGEEVIRQINTSGADFLVVALGARKGQAWIEHNRARITVPVISHLGAVMNFVAGTVRRAPAWMQRSGLEWLWRIKEEPTLRSRYFADGMALLGLLLTHVLPYVWYLRFNHPTTVELDAASVVYEKKEVACKVSIKGAWSAQNISKLRPCLQRASASGQDIELEITGVTYVDSAFIGLIMLLYKSKHRHGHTTKIVGSNKQIQSVFRWNCAEFLLD